MLPLIHVALAPPRVPSDLLVVPGERIGKVRIGSLGIGLNLGASDGDRLSDRGYWSTWLGRGVSRLDVYSEVPAGHDPEGDDPILVVRVTGTSFRTAGGLGPGLAEARMRRAFPRARDVGTYRPPAGGPPIHLFDDVRGGFAFEVSKGGCLAVLVHPRGRGAQTVQYPVTRYLAEPLKTEHR